VDTDTDMISIVRVRRYNVGIYTIGGVKKQQCLCDMSTVAWSWDASVGDS
jgi:hypothetical protein